MFVKMKLNGLMKKVNTFHRKRMEGDDTAAAKMEIMRECGISVVESPADIGETMAKLLGK